MKEPSPVKITNCSGLILYDIFVLFPEKTKFNGLNSKQIQTC